MHRPGLDVRNCAVGLLLAAALLTAGCLSRLPSQEFPVAGTYRVPTPISFQLARRDFLLHVPPRLEARAPLPLLVVLHGAFSGATQIERETGFSGLADREGLLVAYPEGIGLFGLLQHWNAGHCCGRAATKNWDDVEFVAEVIASVQRRFPVDPARIYLAGMSNGGMFAYRFAAERGEILAGLAVVAGALGSRLADTPAAWQMPQPPHPLPLLAVHGTGDGHVPYEGGVSPIKQGERSYLPVSAAIDFWRERNGCEPEALRQEQRAGAVSIQRWQNCRSGAPVSLVTLAGWRHAWPAPPQTALLPPDDPLHGFDASVLIWDFFKTVRRPAETQQATLPSAPETH